MMTEMRPYLRSHLARTLYNRMMEDGYEQQRDHNLWYVVEKTDLPADVCERFVQLHEDEATKEFLENCYAKADWILTQIMHLVIKAALSIVMTNTSINGLLGRGSMFVFSAQQFNSLMGVDNDWKTSTLLDLGAGDGMVTQHMAPHFDTVYTTEVSYTMVWRLQAQSYQVLGIEDWSNGSHQFDVISCLNLLDRCNKPLSILQQIRASLTPGSGRAVIATVIPFKPYVESGGNNHQPEQYLHVTGQTFEEQVTSFVKDVFEPAGFTLQSFSRVPYLCEGDLEHSFYLLDDAIFVLKPS